MLSPVQRCAFEDAAAAPSAACNRVVWADCIMWTLTSACYFNASCFNWMAIYHLLIITHEELPRWIVHNPRLVWSGVTLTVNGFFCCCAAIATRCYLNSEDNARGLIMGSIFASCCLIPGYVWWFASVMSIHGLPVRSLPGYQLGQFGFATNFATLFPGKFADHASVSR